MMREYTQAEIMELFKEEGRQEGLEEGENKLASLLSKLMSLGKNSEVAKAIEDQTYRHLLYAEYGIA